MARGQNVIIQTGSSQLLTAPNGEENQSFAILNPNDGIVYVAINGNASLSIWDFKLPSQSYGAFPGPWQSVGLFFLDQSGAGRSGELTVYTSADKFTIPDIHSIGRALQAQVTAMDLSTGQQPASPASGVDRLWASTNDILHLLNSQGTDKQIVDTLLQLGGALSGTLPNPQLAPGAAFANLGSSSISGFTYGMWANAASSSAGQFVATGDTVSYTPRSNSNMIFGVYFGSLLNTASSDIYTAFYRDSQFSTFGSRVTRPLGAGVPTPFTNFELVGNLSATPHQFQGYWMPQGGNTVSFFTGVYRVMLIIEFDK